jgi:hypothetical protein
MKNSRLQIFTKKHNQLRLLKNGRKKTMFKNIYKLLFALLLFAFISTNITQAQTKKTTYPIFSLGPVIGVQFPAGGLNDIYKASWDAGLDLNLKVNRETSFFLNATYFNMPARTDAEVPGPDGAFIAITAGPRYIFATPQLKANFFLEAGLGAYIHTSKEFVITTVTPNITVASTSKTNMGVNVGPGVLIPVGGTTFIIMKAKLHYIFESGASRTFVSGIAGVDFKL